MVLRFYQLRYMIKRYSIRGICHEIVFIFFVENKLTISLVI